MKFHHTGAILRLAGPLILSMSTITLLQVIDAVVLGHHSVSAVAAMGPSTFSVILVQGLFFGASGYAGTLVAMEFGRNNPTGVRRKTWLGILFSTWGGLAALLLAWPLGKFFFWLGHTPEVAAQEAIYFRVMVAGTILPTLSSALSGWLSGIGRTRAAFSASLISFLVNALLTPPWVLGFWGFPRWGILGAALSTLVAQTAGVLWLLWLFRSAGGFAHPEDRRHPRHEWRRFLGLAVPHGMRISTELVAWTAFLAFIGRLGTEALAASSIVFRINGLAFFPAWGLGQATGILVAQSHGAKAHQRIWRIAMEGLGIGGAWMIGFALILVLAPMPLLRMFQIDSPQTLEIAVVLMRFVAFYCLFDAGNVVLSGVLASLGDTKWVLSAFLISTGTFLLGLALLDAFAPSIWSEWSLATVFVLTTALLWLARLRHVVSGFGKTS